MASVSIMMTVSHTIGDHSVVEKSSIVEKRKSRQRNVGQTEDWDDEDWGRTRIRTIQR